MTNTCVLHRSLNHRPRTVVSGTGLWLTDADGREYLDAVSGGAAVSCLGHGEPRVGAAIKNQLNDIAYAHTSFFSSNPAEELASELIANTPDGLSHVLFCSGGSEAVEAALKLARQTWVERGRPEKQRVISRRQSYHGATLGALSVGGNLARREIYSPFLFDAPLIEPCYAYRLQEPRETEEDYGKRAASDLERAILELGPETVAAFIAEPVVGATLGCAPAVRGYLRHVREICDRYEVLLILDEIMCGTGRTGTFLASEEDGVTGDLVTIAKGLGGGYQPIGAVLVSEAVVSSLNDGSGAIRHGFTYMAHPVACAAALEVIRIVKHDRLLQNVLDRGQQLQDGLRAQLQSHPHVGDVRGRGLLVGVELVADRDTKAPFDPALALHAQLKRTAFEQGLMIYPGGGTIDGRRGDHVVFAPAFTVSADEVDEIVMRFQRALDITLSDVSEGRAAAGGRG